MELFVQYVEKGLQFVSKRCTQAMSQVDISKVTTLCCLLEALLFNKGLKTVPSRTLNVNRNVKVCEEY